MIRRSFDPFLGALVVVVSLSAAPAHALFTGSDQYDRADLNSESRVDLDYGLHLLAFRPFWEPEPMSPVPQAAIRTTEGSLNTKDLFVRREAEFRLHVSSGMWWGYRLAQWEDVEQSSFDQIFSMRVGRGRGAGFRFFGQPTADKQDADIGFGADWESDKARGLLAVRFVDFNFNEKNKANDYDRQDLYSIRAEGGWIFGETAVEAAWDLDTPVERELPDDGQIFNHRAWTATAALRRGPWSARGFWENHRRSDDELSTGIRRQDFSKEAGGVRAEREIALQRHRLRPSLGLERRRSTFTSTVLPHDSKNRWQLPSFVEFDWVMTERLSIPLGVYSAVAWDPGGHCTAQGELRTPLRFDFTPNIRLVLSATWDLDELGTTRSFDGGNVQFEGRLW